MSPDQKNIAESVRVHCCIDNAIFDKVLYLMYTLFTNKGMSGEDARNHISRLYWERRNTEWEQAVIEAKSLLGPDVFPKIQII
jgi:hypothetical protein